MYNGNTTIQEYKNLHKKLFLFERKIMGQTRNNFIILNRNYNTWRHNLSKQILLFFFSLTALFFTLYLSQFSLALYIFLLFYLVSLTQLFKTAPVLTSLFSPFFSVVHQVAEWPYFSFSSFLPSTCLTSLTSHLHSCGLTFVHGYREKRITSILFLESFSSKHNQLC